MSDRQAAGHLAEKSPGLGRAVVAEAIGTFLLVLLGCGVVHSAVLLGAQQGVWQVASSGGWPSCWPFIAWAPSVVRISTPP